MKKGTFYSQISRSRCAVEENGLQGKKSGINLGGKENRANGEMGGLTKARGRTGDFLRCGIQRGRTIVRDMGRFIMRLISRKGQSQLRKVHDMSCK